MSLGLGILSAVAMIWGALLEFDRSLASIAQVVGIVGWWSHLLTFPVSLYSVVAALLGKFPGNSPRAWAIIPLLVLVIAAVLHVRFWGFSIFP